MFILSAKLEEADSQFEELRTGVRIYQNNIQEKLAQAIEKGEEFNEELNVDSLQAFLDLNFPERKGTTGDTQRLLMELRKNKIDYNMLISLYNKAKPYLGQIEKETFTKPTDGTWSKNGIVRQILSVTIDSYRAYMIPEKYAAIDKKYAKIIKENDL